MDTENQNAKNQKNNIGKKQLIGMIIGIVIGIAAVTILFDVIGIGQKYNNAPVQITQSQSEIEKNVSFGICNDDTYINDSANICFKLPNTDWSFKNVDEIMAIMEDSNPKTDNNGKVFTENDVEICYYDMIAFDNVNATSVQIAVSVGKSDSYTAATTSNLYLNNFKQICLQADGNANASDIYDVKIADDTYKAIDIDYAVSSACQTIAVKKAGNSYLIVEVTRYRDMDQNTNQSYLDMIY